MFDWDDLRYFLAVQRGETLAAASAALRINATTVGRRLTSFEEQIGARLFDRTPDGYVLTPQGRDLLPHAMRMEAEVLAAERSVIGADQRLAGVVRVNATEMLATRFIAPRLTAFHEQHPEITLDLNCTLRSVHLGRREADIALRLSRPHEDNVVTKRLACIRLGLYASPSYVQAFGMPDDAEQSLSGHRVLMFADTHSFSVENEWLAGRLDGARIALRSDSVSALYSAAVAGVGIGLVPSAVADPDPALVRIPTRSEPVARDVWQTVHADLQRSPRIRVVLEFLAGLLAPSTNAASDTAADPAAGSAASDKPKKTRAR
jgi:DNA-binding transcriptional LysR family regulator